jgi:hypothetical protein
MICREWHLKCGQFKSCEFGDKFEWWHSIGICTLHQHLLWCSLYLHLHPHAQPDGFKFQLCLQQWVFWAYNLYYYSYDLSERNRSNVLKLVSDQPNVQMGLAESTLNTLLKLDSYSRPGLSRVEFRRLFVKCDRCELVMTHRVMPQHNCHVLVPAQ